MIDECSAWNPGLASDIPPAYLGLETIYRAENVSSRLEDVAENSQQTGLDPLELVVFRPERLALHELIVRVTADILVPEGKDESELGNSFRRIVRRILSGYIHPRMRELSRLYDELQYTVYQRVQRELTETLFAAGTAVPSRNGFLSRFLQRTRKEAPKRRETILEREHRAISTLADKGQTAESQLDQAIFRSLHRVLEAISGNRGYLGTDLGYLTTLVCNQVCNRRGSEIIGGRLAPWIAEAIEQEGYPRVAGAAKPLLISLKGASAAGKSSLRPMLRQMMSDQGMMAEGYATISPDIWRRLLLDYDALGEAYKYAGRLTSQEVIVIDGKLDRYIRSKADLQGTIPHLLVDRFRFDSFSTERVSKVLHGTYVRHVDTLYMYFVVTPPHATVERGWERGLRTGRYKAVEDYLDHSVEAYVGMPKILFKWLAYDRPSFKYEFLDNSVPKGTFPKTIAFGTQHEISILDCSVFVDIERYQKINIRARTPEEVYPTGRPWSVANNLGFLRRCVKKIPTVNFVDPVAKVTYLKAHRGIFSILDEAIFESQLEDVERAQIFSELAPHLPILEHPQRRLRDQVTRKETPSRMPPPEN